MTNEEIAQLVTDAQAYLVQTTQGYKNHTAAWYANTTTNWYKGLKTLDQAVTELRKIKTYLVTISLAKTTTALVATIKVS